MELKTTSAEDEALRAEFERVQSEMRRIDPAGLAPTRATIWPTVLQDFEAMGLE